MEFKQLESFVAVVRYRSFTKAAESLFISQPTISTHVRMLEEELHSRLIIRSTKNIEITPRGWEMYECASSILGLRDDLVKSWTKEAKKMIHLGASTIPSAYILPELLPEFGKLFPDVYFVVNQGDSQEIAESLLGGKFDIGLIGMKWEDDRLDCVPFYQDKMVLVTPVNERYLSMKEAPELLTEKLLGEPIILREHGSGTRKSADRFFMSLGIDEKELNVAARINDQESIKNLVAGGLGISVISERAARNFVKEKRLLQFELPKQAAGRYLYLIYHKDYILKGYVEAFIKYLLDFYKPAGSGD